MMLKILSVVAIVILVGCTSQPSSTEKSKECVQLTKLAQKSINNTVFAGDSKNANQAADIFELNARTIRETKFRDEGLKDTAEKLAVINEENAKTAKEIAKTIDELNQKIGDSKLSNQLKEQGNKMTELGDKVTKLIDTQLIQCLK